MKKHLLFFSACICFQLSLAQKPQLTLQCDAGPWYGHQQWPDPYSQKSRTAQIFLGLGAGIMVPLTQKITLSPEIGCEFYRWEYKYLTTKDRRQIRSDIGILYMRISPGITFQPAPWFSVRAGIAAMGLLTAWGQYEIVEYFSGTQPKETTTYTNHFSRILNPLLVGPELSIGIQLPLDDGSSIGLRVTGMMAINKVMRSETNTPYNPSIARLSAGLCYVIGCRKEPKR